MGAISGGSEKAHFIKVGGGTFYVQFNPKEVKLDESASWKTSEEAQQDRPLLTYERGEPSKMSFDLFFDTTDTQDSVYDKYISELRSFLTASEDPTDGDGSEGKRPPYCTFCWGPIRFECVVEKVGVAMLMFASDGTPIRAKASIALKERQREDYALAGNSSVT